MTTSRCRKGTKNPGSREQEQTWARIAPDLSHTTVADQAAVGVEQRAHQCDWQSEPRVASTNSCELYGHALRGILTFSEWRGGASCCWARRWPSFSSSTLCFSSSLRLRCDKPSERAPVHAHTALRAKPSVFLLRVYTHWGSRRQVDTYTFCTCTQTCACTCTHMTRAHTHTHAHTHIHSPRLSRASLSKPVSVGGLRRSRVQTTRPQGPSLRRGDTRKFCAARTNLAVSP